jgi:transposase-like protein
VIVLWDEAVSQEPIKIIHAIGPEGEPKCPKCGLGLESEGGSVARSGSYDWGPLYWWCTDCNYDWGHL